MTLGADLSTISIVKTRRHLMIQIQSVVLKHMNGKNEITPSESSGSNQHSQMASHPPTAPFTRPHSSPAFSPMEQNSLQGFNSPDYLN